MEYIFVKFQHDRWDFYFKYTQNLSNSEATIKELSHATTDVHSFLIIS